MRIENTKGRAGSDARVARNERLNKKAGVELMRPGKCCGWSPIPFDFGTDQRGLATAAGPIHPPQGRRGSRLIRG